MIGDVNLFLNDPDDSQCGEIEIMIAEPSARQKGFGLETLQTFLRYGNDSLRELRLTSFSSHSNSPFETVHCENRSEEHAEHRFILEKITFRNGRFSFDDVAESSARSSV